MMTFSKPWLLLAAPVAIAAGGLSVALTAQGSDKSTVQGSGSQVLGEKTTQPPATSGSGSAGPAAKPSPNPTPGSNGAAGNGNGGGANDNKTFTIAGQLADDLEPGSATHLTFSVTNTTNQLISVDTLSAALDHVVLAAGKSGCTPTNAGLTVGNWSGSSFAVAKGATANAPGFVNISMDSTSASGCQGAELWFHFTGTASK